MAAIVTRPSVTDTALEVELGFFGEQQHATAAWALWPAKIFGRRRTARGLDRHRRISSTVSLTPAPLSSASCSTSMSLARRNLESLVADRIAGKNYAAVHQRNSHQGAPGGAVIADGTVIKVASVVRHTQHVDVDRSGRARCGRGLWDSRFQSPAPVAQPVAGGVERYRRAVEAAHRPCSQPRRDGESLRGA